MTCLVFLVCWSCVRSTAKRRYISPPSTVTRKWPRFCCRTRPSSVPRRSSARRRSIWRQKTDTSSWSKYSLWSSKPQSMRWRSWVHCRILQYTRCTYAKAPHVAHKRPESHVISHAISGAIYTVQWLTHRTRNLEFLGSTPGSTICILGAHEACYPFGVGELVL